MVATQSGTNTKTSNARRVPVSKDGEPDSLMGSGPNYPRHSLDKALRIPRALLEQNAGKASSDEKAAQFAGVGYHGPTRMEISSSLKYGLLSRPRPGSVELTDLAKKILRPHKGGDQLEGKRAAALMAPGIKDVYSHYRGENLPDPQFLANTLTDTFKIPSAKVPEFLEIFLDTMRQAELADEKDGKVRLLDMTGTSADVSARSDTLARLGREVNIGEGDTCFVMTPFSPPFGGYYDLIYEKAIVKAGLKPMKADADIFGTGKIMDQIWRGIREAKVLLAELTTKNPNVYYELGLAHALGKPVVLLTSEMNDVPFDLRHIRVIYYDKSDPYWGEKLLNKVAENILSAMKNPEEAVLESALSAVP